MKTESESTAGRNSLWSLTWSPFVWVAHFLASYLTAALFCAKVADGQGAAGPVQLAILLYTMFAIPPVAWLGWKGWQHHAVGDREEAHDGASSEARSRFLGFSSFLLSLLSGLAILFTAMVGVLVGSCH